MEKWASGDFAAGDVASPESAIKECTDKPARLTKRALEAGCGGAFFPGIELSSIIRFPSLYSDAFRFNHDKIGPGDLTKYMACPWQADFYECRDAWWPAQRPINNYRRSVRGVVCFFEEEKKDNIEAVLFRRERWDRGLDQKPRPSYGWLLNRLLPEYPMGKAQIN